MNVTIRHIRVLGALWCFVAVLFGASLPFVRSVSCAHMTNPAGADPRWYILHASGGSLSWMANAVLALAIGAALITYRLRLVIVPVTALLCTYFILACVAICAMMIRIPEIFPFNVTLFASSILVAALGVVTIALVIGKEVGEIFRRRRPTPHSAVFDASAPKPSV